LLYFHAARTSFCILHPPIPSPGHSSSPSSPPPPYLYSSFRTVGSVSLTSPYTFSGFSSVRSGISSFSFFIPIPPVIKKTPAAWQIPSTSSDYSFSIIRFAFYLFVCQTYFYKSQTPYIRTRPPHIAPPQRRL